MRCLLAFVLSMVVAASVAAEKPELSDAELASLKYKLANAYQECHGFYQDNGYYVGAACADLSTYRWELGQYGYCLKEGGGWPSVYPCGEQSE